MDCQAYSSDPYSTTIIKNKAANIFSPIAANLFIRKLVTFSIWLLTAFNMEIGNFFALSRQLFLKIDCNFIVPQLFTQDVIL